MALTRAISLPESADKQVRIQAFASIINTMIETCPPTMQSATGQHQSGFRQPSTRPTPSPVNNMMKIMLKKGLVNELARVPLYMDLASSKCIDTINTILKPLETMTKTLNINARRPVAPAAPAKATARFSIALAPAAGRAEAAVTATAPSTQAQNPLVNTTIVTPDLGANPDQITARETASIDPRQNADHAG